MFKELKSNQKGFTIIEVLIVLAIAGLIMLIVFLAIPALQRSQRNNARDAEASRIASAVNECLSNRNGSTDATNGCGNAANVQAGSLQRLDGFVYQTGTGDDLFGTGTNAATTSTAAVRFGRQCNDTGAGSEASTTGSRTFVVLYQKENGINRCISA